MYNGISEAAIYAKVENMHESRIMHCAAHARWTYRTRSYRDQEARGGLCLAHYLTA